MDERKLTAMVLINLSKAFDSICHETLLGEWASRRGSGQVAGGVGKSQGEWASRKGEWASRRGSGQVAAGVGKSQREWASRSGSGQVPGGKRTFLLRVVSLTTSLLTTKSVR